MKKTLKVFDISLFLLDITKPGRKLAICRDAPARAQCKLTPSGWVYAVRNGTESRRRVAANGLYGMCEIHN